MLSVITWAFLLQRVFGDRRLIAVLVPLMALSKCWLEIGYQLAPYSMLTLFASVHCLAWLRLLEKATWDRMLVFALSLVAAVWTHFYGINLLVADQLIWGLLLWRNRSLVKLWWKVSAICLLFCAPVVPILLFYLDVEKVHSLVRIGDFKSYLIAESSLCFGSVTFNVPLLMPVILLWYGAVVTVVWKWLQGCRVHVADVRTNQSAIVLIGFFLAGFPAMQMHSILSGEAMWERYVVYASWSHWPVMVLLVRQFLSRRAAVLTTDGAFAFSWIALVGIVGLGQHWTFDHTPVVKFIAEHAQPDDAFLAQDIDIFAGESSTYRLWFDRYSTIDLKIVTGSPMGRFELQDNGLPLETLDKSINRLWVYSDMFLWTEEKLSRSTEWQPIAKLSAHPRPPLVLLKRVGTVGETTSLDLAVQ